MYCYRDTERDIPNTFDPVSANKFLSVPILIWNLSKGHINRKDLSEDILKRVDAEIKFVRETQVEETQIKKTFMVENEFKNDVL